MTIARPVYVQLGLFGGCAEIAGMHVVSAHTRTLPDGSEVFVGEHVRWNRGRQPRPLPSVRRAPTPDDHPCLFDLLHLEPPQPPSRQPPSPQPTLPVVEIEIFPGAWQLPLFAS